MLGGMFAIAELAFTTMYLHLHGLLGQHMVRLVSSAISRSPLTFAIHFRIVIIGRRNAGHLIYQASPERRGFYCCGSPLFPSLDCSIMAFVYPISLPRVWN
jgi:hypothetical protein